jgi:tetratricopeptide (TPR) repeat protein
MLWVQVIVEAMASEASENHSQALEASIQAVRYLKPASRMAIQVLLIRGEIFWGYHDMIDALAYLHEASGKALASHSYMQQIYALIDIGNIYFDEFRFDSSPYCYQKALTTPGFPADSDLKENSYVNIGNVYVVEKRLELGKKYILKALAIGIDKNMKGVLPLLL